MSSNFYFFFKQAILPGLKAMTWDMVNQDVDLSSSVAVINLKVMMKSIAISK